MSEPSSEPAQRPALLLLSVALVVAGLVAVYFTHRGPDAVPSLDAGPPGEDLAMRLGRGAGEGEGEGIDEGCGRCPSDRPHCDRGEGRCVACEEREHCPGPLPACVNGRCVECETSRDCGSLELPECYFGTHACRACTSDDACLFRGEVSRCIEGRCREATR